MVFLNDRPGCEIEVVGLSLSVDLEVVEKGLLVLGPFVREPLIWNQCIVFLVEILHFSQPGFGATVFSKGRDNEEEKEKDSQHGRGWLDVGGAIEKRRQEVIRPPFWKSDLKLF